SGILGMNADMYTSYMQYIANRRLNSIHLDEMYKGARNPFNWMTEIIDMNKLKNFFETTVTEYTTGAIEDDL
ncbi:MAG: ribonucleotide-diphosphate reductase subunit beta, partial [Endomicrobiia bacterium]